MGTYRSCGLELRGLLDLIDSLLNVLDQLLRDSILRVIERDHKVHSEMGDRGWWKHYLST